MNNLKNIADFQQYQKARIKTKLATSLKSKTALYATRWSWMLMKSNEELPGQTRITESSAGLSLKKQEGQIKCDGYLHRK